VRLILILWWEARVRYLHGMVCRIAARAPLHPERTRTEQELADAQRRLVRAHRSFT
jgi:hypothetical protein